MVLEIQDSSGIEKVGLASFMQRSPSPFFKPLLSGEICVHSRFL